MFVVVIFHCLRACKICVVFVELNLKVTSVNYGRMNVKSLPNIISDLNEKDYLYESLFSAEL